MSKRFGLGVGMWLVAGLAMGSSAQGATVGLWLMDDYFDATPPAGDPPVDPAGGETIPDSSGNNFDFVATTNFASSSLTSDRPAVMPGGTFALDSWNSGSGGFATPSTTLLSRGVTGELSIEFWYKAIAPEPGVVGYILSFGEGSTAGRIGLYRNSDGSLRLFENSGGFTEANTGAGVADGDWHHIGFTIDAAGVRTAYVDGAQVHQTAALGASAPALNRPMHFGGDPTFGWAAHRFLIDELRISDAALLPGNGTGVGELAWNASLVPEPASLALMGLAALALARRRR